MPNADSGRIQILIVDNEPDRHEGLTALYGDATFAIRTPEDVETLDVQDADLISVDEYLGEEWQTYLDAQNASRSLHNIDGLSVAASFRSQGRFLRERFGVSLHTGDLAKLSDGLPAYPREALTAAQHDLDWVFSWQDEGFADRLISLARAVRSAARLAGQLQQDFGASWLGLSDQGWAEGARRQIEDCRPPAHGLARNTQGASYVRWLAQRIVPYPTFLLDEHHAANFLGVTADSFRLLRETDLLTSAGAVFEGPLCDFVGVRWWRAALQYLLETLQLTHWSSSAEKASALSSACGVPLEPYAAENTVVTYDADGLVTDIGVDPSSAVRLQTDGWPVYADDPWAYLRDVADDPELTQLVASTDRHRLRGSVQ